MATEWQRAVCDGAAGDIGNPRILQNRPIEWKRDGNAQAEVRTGEVSRGGAG